MRVILLRNSAQWPAPRSFAWELARSLVRQTERETLLVQPAYDAPLDPHCIVPHLAVCDILAAADRALIANLRETWTSFDYVLLNLSGRDAAPDAIRELVDIQGYLLGPADHTPEDSDSPHFVVQTFEGATLPYLSGNRQLIHDAAEPEHGKQMIPVSARFQRTVDSIARYIAHAQIGLALGGGAAWGWAHIGVLDVFVEAGIPIDVICGSSFGAIIGGLFACGMTPREMEKIASWWSKRIWRFIEWRFWRLHLISERAVRNALHEYFGDRAVNRTDIPFWTNAIDIETAEEMAIRDGSLVDAVRASVSLPGLLPAVPKPPHLLIDALITDPVPARFVREMNADYVISVNSLARPGTSRVRRKHPFRALNIAGRSVFVMAYEIGKARAEPVSDVLINPALEGIGMLQFDRSAEIVDRGRRAAEENMMRIRAGYQRVKETAH